MMRALLTFALLLASLPPASGGVTDARMISASAHPKRPVGFVDYALGKVNPNEKDYGAIAIQTRGAVVLATLRSIYFWSNVVSLTLLMATATAFYLVLRTREKREMIAASLILQLWNGRVIDRREIARRTALYNGLVDAKNTGSYRNASAPANEHSRPEKIDPRIQDANGALSSPPKGAPTVDAPERGFEEAQQKTRLLEGQNQALRNSERNLRERLNQVTQDLEQERRRNQTLKGA